MELRIKSKMQTLTTFFVIAATLTSTQASCPSECTCFEDMKRRYTVECKQGGLTGELPLANINPKLKVLKVYAPDNNLNEISMNPNIGDFRELEEIHITRSNIPNLGIKFFLPLARLEVLDFSENNITQPLPENFRGLSRLKELNLDDNRIYSLPSETFRYLSELRVLSLQKNRIDQMMPGLFRGLGKLKVLKLNGNAVKEFNPEVFKDFKDLRLLECRGCSLSQVNPDVNLQLPLLTHLDLGVNDITMLNSSSFINLTMLRSVKLDTNQISELPADLFANHSDLKKLNFARNKITKLNVDAFRNLFNLSDLDLGYNQLRNLERDTFKDAAEVLERLVLSGNHIPFNQMRAAIEGCRVLKDLQIADAGLADLGAGGAAFLPKTLTVLNLGGNQLSYLPDNALPDELKELDISRNMFRGLDGEVVKRIETMRCRLENNPWSCDLCHIVPMLDRVNKSAVIYNVRCALPNHHEKKLLGNLRREQLSWCSAAGYSSGGAGFFLNRDDGRLEMIAAGASVLLLVLTSLFVLAALCYSRRHAANYYTHEEKRLDEREALSVFDNQSPFFGEELSFKFPLDANDKKITIATIDEISKEHQISNGT